MLNLLSLSILALALSSASALVLPRLPSPDAPSNWSNSLEDYDTYHHRYLAIGCQNRHSDVAYFDQCCHPLSRGANPNPSCATASDDDGSEFDGDCEDDDDSTYPPPAYYSSPTPSKGPNDQARSANVGDLTVTAEVNTSNGGSGYQYGGVATFYYQGGNAGACGDWHGDYDMIAAIDSNRYGNTGRHSSLCGKRVQITNTNNGKTVTVTIADACPTCKNGNSIDLSVGAFHKIATEEEGMVPIKWKYV